MKEKKVLIQVFCDLQYYILPRARRSLRTLQELPIIVVLMFQIYKTSVQTEVAEFIPIVMKTIILQPTPAQK
jgi:transformation/transcription domain-associated protein